MSLAAGRSLLHYRILGPLGAGAMGQVYRAHDTRLDRDVAIKVLPAELATSSEGLQRFEREARTLAALSHPNLAHMYGIDRVGDTRFMAMELVPGEDLAARLSRGALPVAEALDVCRQIAEGLEAAHEAGVIHRDLKPANVVITPEGTAKVLDFGLAKAAGAGASGSGSTGSVLSTEEGRLLGTPTYMAPEQARGKPIDKRVDVWAFGCVLYECLCGRRIFSGETISDVLAAVLEKEPDWSSLPGSTPGHVRRLLRRCLDKDPRTRLRDMGEARIALGPHHEEEEPAARPSRAGPALLLAAFAAGALVVAAVLMVSRPAATPPSPLDGAAFIRLTDSPHTESSAAISPNGDFIAYASDRDGRADLWVTQIDGGEPMNFTRGTSALSQSTVSVAVDPVRCIGFDGDGSRVWFLQDASGTHIDAAPKTGGRFEPLLEPGMAEPAWSRDGSRLVYHTDKDGDPLHVRATDGPPSEPILTAGRGTHQHFPVWSFDQEWIFFVRGSMSTREMDLWRVRPDGSEAEQLTDEPIYVTFPTPIDAHTVLFIANDAADSGPWLWSLDLPSRRVRRISVGTEQYRSVAASADGRRLVATKADPKAALWRIPIQDEPVLQAEALPGIPSLRALAPRYAGGQLFYLSSRGAGDGLFVLQEGRARPIWLHAREPLAFLPAISPDGRLVALMRRQANRMTLSVLSVDSGQILRELDGTIDVRGSGSWSPDMKQIAIGGIDPEGPGLFLFPSDGGPAKRILAGQANDPVWSPTEDLIVYCGAQVGPMMPMRGVRTDGEPVELSSEVLEVRQGGERVRFLPDGSGVIYLKGTSFWHLDLASGATRKLAELSDPGVMRTFDVTPDGRGIVFDRLQQNSDIVLIELPERGTAR